MKKQKSKYKNTDFFSFLGAVVIIIGLILHYTTDFLDWGKFTLITFIIIFILGGIGFNDLIEQTCNVTEEQSKNNKKIISLWVFTLISLALCIYFFIIENMVLLFIFGVIALISITYNTLKSFVNVEHKTTINKTSLILDFVFSFGLSIFLIYCIKNEELKRILIPAFAALFGGIITLTGVAWTIKQTDRNRRDDIILKNKPIVFVKRSRNTNDADIQQVDVKYYFDNKKLKTNKNTRNIKINNIYLKNSDNSYCTIKGLFINDTFIEFDYGQILDKKQLYEFILEPIKIGKKVKVKTFSLYIIDIMNNSYEFILRLNQELLEKDIIQVESCLDTVKL